MSNNTVIIVIVAAVLYIMATGAGNAATTTAQGGQGCLQSIQAQYSGQWAEMNTVQRAMVGLRAASCEGGK